MAEVLQMPVAYSGKILQELAKKNIVTSLKGPGGGFYLNEKNLASPVINIIEAVDGLSVFESCGLGLSECSAECPCPFHHQFKVGRDTMKETFSNKSISDMAKEIKTNSWSLV